jgi:cob(I)alamin adenosyltransferase
VPPTTVPGARLQQKEKSSHGLLIVYTGNGKGKTTAALGMALRAIGRGWRALMIQFGKGTWHYAELDTVKRLEPDFQIIPMGKGFYKILDDHYGEEEHREAAERALEFSHRQIVSGKYDLIILDEISGAVGGGLLTLESVTKLIDDKPEELTLVLTGRNAPQALIERADLVTEMREIKHPFQKGMMAQKGIDY